MPTFLEKKLAKYVKKTYPKLLKVSTNDEMALFNCRSHLNAIEAYNLGKAVGIIECVVMVNEGDPMAHFINIRKDGSYVDYSLGRAALALPYHFVRTVDPSEFSDPVKMLKTAKSRIVDAVVPKFLTKLGIIDKYSII